MAGAGGPGSIAVRSSGTGLAAAAGTGQSGEMPLAVRIVVVIIFLAVGFAAGATVLLHRSGRLRRTGRAGVRTPAAMASDEGFAAANATAAPFLTVAAIVSLLSAVLFAATGINGVGGALSLLGCGIVVGGLAVFAAARGDRVAARTAPPARGTPAKRRR